jgi:hypothetical protein
LRDRSRGQQLPRLGTAAPRPRTEPCSYVMSCHTMSR